MIAVELYRVVIEKCCYEELIKSSGKTRRRVMYRVYLVVLNQTSVLQLPQSSSNLQNSELRSLQNTNLSTSQNGKLSTSQNGKSRTFEKEKQGMTGEHLLEGVPPPAKKLKSDSVKSQ